MVDGAGELRERCTAVLSEVRLPHRFTRRSITTAMRRDTGRDLSVSVVPSAQIHGAFGMLARTAERDYVWLAQQASQMTQTFTLAHEWGHLLNGEELQTVDEVLVQTYGSEGVLLEPGYGRHFSQRCFQTADDEAERIADEFARQIMQAATGAGSFTEALPRDRRNPLDRIFG